MSNPDLNQIRREAIRDYLSGTRTIREVAADHPVGHNTLQRWLMEEGLSRPRGRGPRQPARSRKLGPEDVLDPNGWVRDGLVWKYEGVA